MHSQPWRVRAGLLPYKRERLGRPTHPREYSDSVQRVTTTPKHRKTHDMAVCHGAAHVGAGGRRIPIIVRVPARVHWLSVAPLLEPLDLRPWLGRGVDWIIVGGETGAKHARYMAPDWARDLRDQCRMPAPHSP
jgi:protein gp37